MKILILLLLNTYLKKKVRAQCRHIYRFEDVVAIQSWEKQIALRLTVLSRNSSYRAIFSAAYKLLTTSKDTEWCIRYYK